MCDLILERRVINGSPKRKSTSFEVPFLRLLHEFFPAAGAGDGDLALAPGDPDHLAAFGTVEIPVIPVLQPVKDLQKFPVFLVALVGVPGKDPENGQKHQYIA